MFLSPVVKIFVQERRMAYGKKLRYALGGMVPTFG
jgi:hypothetical protein